MVNINISATSPISMIIECNFFLHMKRPDKMTLNPNLIGAFVCSLYKGKLSEAANVSAMLVTVSQIDTLLAYFC